MKAVTLVLLVVALTSQRSVAQSGTSRSCTVSPTIRAMAPADPDVDSFGPSNWYVNTDRSLWVGVPDSGWASGGSLYSGGKPVKGQKTYWVRPRGTQLTIRGHRLDAVADPVEAHVPCCYNSGFQIVGLYFPTQGCWEIAATSGESRLQFVTEVKP